MKARRNRSAATWAAAAFVATLLIIASLSRPALF